MHDKITEKLIDWELLVLKTDYRELRIRTRAGQLSEKVNRIIRLKEEQIRLLHDLLAEMDRFTVTGEPIDAAEPIKHQPVSDTIDAAGRA